jgi:hypothetical protein
LVKESATLSAYIVVTGIIVRDTQAVEYLVDFLVVLRGEASALVAIVNGSGVPSEILDHSGRGRPAAAHAAP